MGKRRPTVVDSRSWEERMDIGEVSVDSGTLAIIDPCYLQLPSFWQDVVHPIDEPHLPPLVRENLQHFRAGPEGKMDAEGLRWFDYTVQLGIGARSKTTEPALAAIREAARALRDKGIVFGTGGDATWKLTLVSKLTETTSRVGTTGRTRTVTQAWPLRIEFDEVG
ncbi:hypothetical protein HYZ80_02415 [Candidatus Parcubacteria bacterium]|nr:hypothetical protein [Candidatus Parcubacteria bacterium]